jgi:hypothetical protein
MQQSSIIFFWLSALVPFHHFFFHFGLFDFNSKG